MICLVLPLSRAAWAGELPALIDVAELLKFAPEQRPVIIEIVAPDRPAPDAHIPRARLSHFEADGWVIDYEGLPGMLPPPDKLSQLGARLGIRPQDTVVLVAVETDNHGLSAVTRAFWTLRMMGHVKLHLLDGGLPAYRANGAPLVDNATAHAPSAPYPQDRFSDTWLTDSGGVYDGGDYGTSPLDVRESDRSNGFITHPLVENPGTIYGADNVPPAAFVTGGHFKPAAKMHALMDDVIGKPPGPIIVFSDTGYTASIGWFAIREVMKHKDVRLYDGGYIEWDDLGYETYDSRNDMGDALG